MARWQPHIITRGPLAGQFYASQMEYMNARAREFGFTSYAQERAAKANPIYTAVRQRALAKGQSRGEATRTANRIVGTRFTKSARGTHVGTPHGIEMSRAIEAMYDEGLWDPGEDADEVFY